MKKYNGIELLQAIKNKEIEPDTKISIKGRFSNKAMYIKAPSNKFLYQDDFQIYEEDGKPYDKGFRTGVIVASDLLNYTFEIADKSILDEKEKEYLRAVIRPFRDKISNITKSRWQMGEYIEITMEDLKDSGELEQSADTIILLPTFKSGSMYTGMESSRSYSLEELGL